MKDFKKLDLIPNVIYETIVSTYNKNNTPNAAPMGIKIDKRKNVLISPFTSSQTYKNLDEQKCGVINITTDPLVFLKTAFKENDSIKLLQSWFIEAKCVNAPKLKNVNAHIEFCVIEKEMESNNRARFICKTKFIDVVNQITPIYCRAYFAVIESIIHSTRIKMYIEQKNTEMANRLKKLVYHYYDITKKISPNTVHMEIMDQLLELIDKWEEKIRSES